MIHVSAAVRSAYCTNYELYVGGYILEWYTERASKDSFRCHVAGDCGLAATSFLSLYHPN